MSMQQTMMCGKLPLKPQYIQGKDSRDALKSMVLTAWSGRNVGRASRMEDWRILNGGRKKFSMPPPHHPSLFGYLIVWHCSVNQWVTSCILFLNFSTARSDYPEEFSLFVSDLDSIEHNQSNIDPLMSIASYFAPHKKYFRASQARNKPGWAAA